MSEYLIQGKSLSDIADAIREKAGSTDAMTPAEMVQAILGIQAGGGNDSKDEIEYGLITPAENLVEFSPTTHRYQEGHFVISIANINGVSLSNGAIKTVFCNGVGWASQFGSIQGASSVSTNILTESGKGAAYSFKSCFLLAGVTYAYVYYRHGLL